MSNRVGKALSLSLSLSLSLCLSAWAVIHHKQLPLILFVIFWKKKKKKKKKKRAWREENEADLMIRAKLIHFVASWSLAISWFIPLLGGWPNVSTWRTVDCTVFGDARPIVQHVLNIEAAWAQSSASKPCISTWIIVELLELELERWDGCALVAENASFARPTATPLFIHDCKRARHGTPAAAAAARTVQYVLYASRSFFLSFVP